ncbi:GAF domain-containing protein, partial [Streptomyces roseolus]|uniref:GAF domain-containing protein n=1 Tax=Streptomyces roseolus TaxID=67358 RepID=UPI0036471241
MGRARARNRGTRSLVSAELTAARTPTSPATRPRTRSRAEPALGGAGQSQPQGTERGWTVIETLRGTPEQISVVLHDGAPRSFSKLARARLPRTLLETVVAECMETGQTSVKAAALEDDRVFRVVGMPIPGPSGGVFAVVIWSASITEPMPEIPKVGTVEWTPSGLLTASAGAEYLLRPPHDLPHGRSVPELLASFDRWDDRSQFLEMFNFNTTPTDQWTGVASKHYEDGSYHQFYIAARAVGNGEYRRVRGVVSDVTATSNPRSSDMAVAMLRAVPIPPGHVLALVDLGSGFAHEWLTDDHLLAGWRHHNPLYDNGGRERVTQVCVDLALGTREHATVDVRV